MRPEEFIASRRRYRRHLIMWQLLWFVGLSIVIFALGVSMGVGKALGRDLGLVLGATLGVLAAYGLIRANARFMMYLLKSHGLVCPSCAKGLLSGKNSNLAESGKCGYCGVELFE
jgi:hypothetical protein